MPLGLCDGEVGYVSFLLHCSVRPMLKVVTITRPQEIMGRNLGRARVLSLPCKERRYASSEEAFMTKTCLPDLRAFMTSVRTHLRTVGIARQPTRGSEVLDHG